MSAVFDTLKFAQTTSEQLPTKSDLREETAPLKAELLLIKWMMGFVLAFQVLIFGKLFLH